MDRMDQFVRRANIELYRRLLERTKSPAEYERILRLLEVEEVKAPNSVPSTGPHEPLK